MIYEWYFFEDCRTYCWSIVRVIAIWTHSLKTEKATYKSKHWTGYRLNGVCSQCFRPLSQVLRFRLTWNCIIKLRLTNYTCIKFWRCLNLSFSFLYFRISYTLFHLNIIPSNYLFKNWNQVRHSENHDMYLILIFRMFYF